MIPIIKDLGKVCVTPCEVYDEEKEYDILCLVSDELKTKLYVSKKIVPAGTPLEDTDYWSCLLDFDDQLKEYKEFYEEIKDYIEVNEERIKEVYDTAFKVWDQDVTEGLDGNMNALLDPGIYAKCYIGRPNPTYNNALYTLQVLKGEKASPYFEGSGAKIQELVYNWLASEQDNITLNGFSKDGTYIYDEKEYPEHYNLTAIGDNEFTTFSSVLPPGNYNINVVVYPSHTSGRNIPAPTTTPLIFLTGNGSGGQLTNDSNSQADYDRTSLNSQSKASHGIFYLNTDENGVLQFTLTSANAGYNWFVYYVIIRPVAVATGSYDVIPQICMNHATGDIYRRVLYSKELDVDQSERHFAPPYTLYPRFEAFTDAPELEPIQDNPYSGWEKVAKLKDIKDIKETYRLDEMYDIIFSLSDSDNVINKFNEIKEFLAQIPEDAHLFTILDELNTTVNNLANGVNDCFNGYKVNIELNNEVIFKSTNANTLTFKVTYGNSNFNISSLVASAGANVLAVQRTKNGSEFNCSITNNLSLVNNVVIEATVKIYDTFTVTLSKTIKVVDKIYYGFASSPNMIASYIPARESYIGGYSATSNSNNLGFYIAIPQSMMIMTPGLGKSLDAYMNGVPVSLVYTGVRGGTGGYANAYIFGIGSVNNNTFTPQTYPSGTTLNITIK